MKKAHILSMHRLLFAELQSHLSHGGILLLHTRNAINALSLHDHRRCNCTLRNFMCRRRIFSLASLEIMIYITLMHEKYSVNGKIDWAKSKMFFEQWITTWKYVLRLSLNLLVAKFTHISLTKMISSGNVMRFFQWFILFTVLLRWTIHRLD